MQSLLVLLRGFPHSVSMAKWILKSERYSQRRAIPARVGRLRTKIRPLVSDVSTYSDAVGQQQTCTH